jgi:peptidoglycan/LPS O-acetylase OafA/YrhL
MSEFSPNPPPMAGRNHFLLRIESLRGLAAFSVAVHHSYLFIQPYGKWDGEINRGMIQAVFYGRGAVLCFFILSGLVLGQSLRRLKPSKISDILIFYVRRVLRIGPAFVVSLLFCLFLLAAFSFWKSTNPAATDWYSSFYGFKPSWAVLLSNIRMRQTSLNGVTWSLYPELVGSLMLPWLHIASKSLLARASILLVLLGLQLAPLPATGGLVGTLPCLWLFYLGYLIADLPAFFWAYLKNNAKMTTLLLAMAWLVCLATPHFGHHPVPYVLAMGFIIAVVFGVPQDKSFTFLDHRVTALLGRISYSFYLFHFPIVYSVASVMFNLFTPGFLTGHYLLMSTVLMLVSIAIATPISWCSYQCIEKPFVSLGKRFSHKKLRHAD